VTFFPHLLSWFCLRPLNPTQWLLCGHRPSYRAQAFLKLALESPLSRLDPKGSEPFTDFPGLTVNVGLSALGFPVVNDRVKSPFGGGLVVVEV
jgi:hypothetical protein